MNLTVTISDKRVSELLFGHTGSVSDWLHSLNGDLADGALAHFDKEDDDEGAGSGKVRFDYAAMAKGLSVMAETEPYQFGQFIAENDDDVTFDTAWQCIIYGKTIYG